MLNDNYKKLAEDLTSHFPQSTILTEEPMKKHTTFKIGGPADIFVDPVSEDIAGILKFLGERNEKYIVIGNGSNLLVSDDGIEGVVVSIGKKSAQISVEDDYIIASAGTLLSQVANAAAEASLTGLEFAAGIPGTIGGAVYMNAGAYGGEIKDVIESVQILTSDYQIKEVLVAELDLSYRHSALMENGGLVLSAKLHLSKGDKAAIRQIMDENRQKRVDKQPLNFPSAGSTFKRPEGYFAGKLIDDAGLRGYAVGGAQVSEKHCGFVVNKGDATASDVLQLMKDVDAKVFDKFGVHLSPEVRIIGRNIN